MQKWLKKATVKRPIVVSINIFLFELNLLCILRIQERNIPLYEEYIL